MGSACPLVYFCQHAAVSGLEPLPTVPFLDRRGRELRESEVQRWVALTQQELTECFGGATAVPAPGTNINSREEFLAHRDRIEACVARMGEDLDQDAVFVLAFDSGSFLIELEEGGQS